MTKRRSRFTASVIFCLWRTVSVIKQTKGHLKEFNILPLRKRTNLQSWYLLGFLYPVSSFPTLWHILFRIRLLFLSKKYVMALEFTLIELWKPIKFSFLKLAKYSMALDLTWIELLCWKAIKFTFHRWQDLCGKGQAQYSLRWIFVRSLNSLWQGIPTKLWVVHE